MFSSGAAFAPCISSCTRLTETIRATFDAPCSVAFVSVSPSIDVPEPDFSFYRASLPLGWRNYRNPSSIDKKKNKKIKSAKRTRTIWKQLCSDNERCRALRGSTLPTSRRRNQFLFDRSPPSISFCDINLPKTRKIQYDRQKLKIQNANWTDARARTQGEWNCSEWIIRVQVLWDWRLIASITRSVFRN